MFAKIVSSLYLGPDEKKYDEGDEVSLKLKQCTVKGTIQSINYEFNSIVVIDENGVAIEVEPHEIMEPRKRRQ